MLNYSKVPKICLKVKRFLSVETFFKSTFLSALLHFGETPDLSKYLNIMDLQKIFTEQEISIFNMIFEIITKNLTNKNIKMIEMIYGGLKMTNDFDQIITISVSLLEQMVKV